MNIRSNNTKALFITYGAFDHASSRTRALLYFPLLQRILFDKITWIGRIPNRPKKNILNALTFAVLKRIYLAKRIILIIFLRYDIVFIQRFFIENLLLRILILKGSKIIFDFDDAIYLNFPDQLKNYRNTIRMLKAADQIIVSSQELANFCMNEGFKNIFIINTPIETDRIIPRPFEDTDQTTIGWIGSPYTTHYLKIIENALKEISKHYKIRLLLIGSQKTFNIEGIFIEQYQWKFESESVFLKQMDIGIMPLLSDKYSKGKGGYKLFQYMAVGIPVVASPIGINTEIVQPNENGFLANSEEEWITYLSYLIEHPEERKRMGRIGRKLAEEKYSRAYCSKQLISVIKPLIAK